MSANADLSRRAVRSFVRREGRMTSAQKRALAELAQQFCLELPSQYQQLDEVFGRYAPRVLEIGCGTGEVITALAASNPANDYIGVEVYRPGVGQTLNRIATQALPNVRLVCADAMVVLRNAFAPASFDEVYVFFPDPWPKKRHLKRRLIQAEFAQLIRAVMKSHARLFVATDCVDYAAHIYTLLQEANFVNLAGWSNRFPRPAWRPVSRYEQRARRAAREIYEYGFSKRYLD